MSALAARLAALRPLAGKLKWPLLVLGGIALAVYFYSPVREVADTTLDGSNYSSYAYFAAHHFQYGTQVVPMAGPYGFVLYGWVYSGELFWTRAAGQLLLTGALAALSLWFLWRNRTSPVAWLWLAAHVAFTPFHDDLGIEWTLLLAGLFLVQSPGGRGKPAALALAALVAWLSLIKGTQLALGLATLGVVVGAWAWQRRWRDAGLLAAGFAGAMLLLWVLAGQNPLHLPAYLHGTFELASGYNEAMSLEEPRALLLRGVAVSLVLAAGVAGALWARRRDVTAVAGLLLLAGHSFVQWKHGFIRADGHAYLYFNFAIVAALTLWLVAWTDATRSRWARGAAGVLVLAVITLCAAGNRRTEPMLPDFRTTPARVGARLAQNFRQLADLPGTQREFARRLEVQRRLFAMPRTRQVVGTHSIDVFGMEHARAPFNDLNYRPRPMSGGPFNVYTAELMRLNRDFLRDPARRPDFYLVRLQTIDGRLLAQDDGLALVALLQLYEPVLLEQEHLLFRARPGAVLPEPRLVSRLTVQIGETVTVPTVGPDEWLLARFDVKPSVLGRLQAAVYKAPRLHLARRGPGIVEPDRRRLIPIMAVSPFVLGPVLETNRELLESYAGRSVPWPREFRLSTADRTWFQRTVGVEFLAVPRPRPTPGVDFEALLQFNTSPIQIAYTRMADTGEPVTVAGQLMHTPCQLTWPLTGTEKTVAFGYGLVPDGYAGTDGVEFTLTLRQPGEPPRRLFHRLLDPAREPRDRGQHEASLPLPALRPGATLEMETGPGPRENTAFDWAYVSDFRFPDPPAGDPGSSAPGQR